jgi:hypothetical protein
LGVLGVNGRIILKWVLIKLGVSVDWIQVAQDMVQWQALVSTVMNIKDREFLWHLSFYQFLKKNSPP